MSARPKRIHHLDSLRGLAALAVAIGHSFYGFSGVRNEYYLSLFLGRIPVIYFFILSGFVLSRSLAFSRVGGEQGYVAYAVKRTFRLYPVALISLLFGLGVAGINATCIPQGIASEWLRNQLVTPLHLLQAFLGCMSLQGIGYNQPIWTIRVEIACSLMLPLMIFLSKKGRGWTIAIILGFGLLMKTHQAGGVVGDLGWGFAFFLGYLISRVEHHLACLNKESTQVLLILWIMVLIGFVGLGMDTVVGVLVMASFMAVMVPCHWPALRALLETKSLQRLGSLSFSFYAIHTPFMILCWKGLSLMCPMVLKRLEPLPGGFFMTIISVSGSLVLANVMSRFLETPSKRWGHRFAAFARKSG